MKPTSLFSTIAPSWLAKAVLVALLLFMLLAGCAPSKTQEPTAAPSVTSIPPTATSIPSSTLIPASPTPLIPTEEKLKSTPTVTSIPPTHTPEALTLTPTPEGLPPTPQKIEFKSSDGVTLTGTYYPAVNKNAPVIVLMHWAGGNEKDWAEITYWLQNRGLSGNTPNPNKFRYYDPTSFPEMIKNQSFAVFTFTFRGCENGCDTWNGKGWVLDSQAAMLKASELEGVDPERIVSIGASIGADGAADGCYWLNQQKGKGKCLGSLAFSPGNYLGVPYLTPVDFLQKEDPPKQVWCVYAVGDAEAAPVCKGAVNDMYKQYHVVEYQGNDHGMIILAKYDLDPDPYLQMLEFLKLAFGF